ncbi:hypothetical protein F4780DRAFT_327051 [Xylariomycetidae sp. FL0641]|nr:hypothetical protein F4780DRAFT_327051 [Xylariomycetidae sp. FL0641]
MLTITPIRMVVVDVFTAPLLPLSLAGLWVGALTSNLGLGPGIFLAPTPGSAVGTWSVAWCLEPESSESPRVEYPSLRYGSISHVVLAQATMVQTPSPPDVSAGTIRNAGPEARVVIRSV